MGSSVLILGALVLNALLGGPRRFYMRAGFARLIVKPAALIRDLERRLNREHRSLSERQTRGLMLVMAGLFVSLIAGWILALLSKQAPFFELLILAVALPLRPAWDIATQISRALKKGDLPSARQALDGTAWRYHALMDDYAVGRAAVEILAVYFSEKIFAAALWYFVFGLPGLLASKCIFLMQETLSQPAGEQGFGKAARATHFVMHYIPSRIVSVFWIAVMSFIPSANPADAVRQVTPALPGASPIALSLLSAASALKLSLGGPTSIYASGNWIGSGTARPSPADIGRALYLFALLCLFLFVLFGLFA